MLPTMIKSVITWPLACKWYCQVNVNHAGGQQEAEYLADAVDNLRTEVELLREEFLKLDERMDFTERLLERPKTEE